jgi:chemotaxis-related protein WspB
MLMVVFHLGDERYAVSANCVIEIVPSVALKAVPHVPAYVAGLFNYRTHVTPVIDLCQLALNRACRPLLSSRILLIDYDRVTGRPPDGRRRILGLLAERVTETCTRPANAVVPPVTVAKAPYLGEIFYTGTEMNQCVELSALLPASVRDMLFAECAASDASLTRTWN